MVKVFFAIFLLGLEFGLDLGKILSNVFRIRLEPMTWEKLRPKILARKFFSGCAGEASWDSFKTFIIPKSLIGLAFWITI